MQQGLKVTTDACLLGALADGSNPLSALDIGTGSGVLTLMLAQKYPKCSIVGVELELQVYNQACNNVNDSKFKKQISIVHSDIAQFNDGVSFDLIVCNPPFFKNHLKSNDVVKNSAIHQTNLSPNLLALTIEKYLSFDGVAWVIYPENESKEFQSLLEKYSLNLNKIVRVYNKPKVLFREVIKVQKRKSNFEESSLLIKNENGKNTEEFNRLMKDYYL